MKRKLGCAVLFVLDALVVAVGAAALLLMLTIIGLVIFGCIYCFNEAGWHLPILALFVAFVVEPGIRRLYHWAKRTAQGG